MEGGRETGTEIPISIFSENKLNKNPMLLNFTLPSIQRKIEFCIMMVRNRIIYIGKNEQMQTLSLEVCG